jgi:oxalate decarboxylase
MAVFLAEGVVVKEQFETGDVGYAPMGAGHYIRNTGPGVLRVLVGFNNGHYLANDLTAWLGSNPPDILSANLGLPMEVVDKLPRGENFMIPGRKGAAR